MLAEWVFPGWDPVLLDLPGPIDLRWYGLTYVIAFLVGALIVTHLCRSGFLRMDERKVAAAAAWLVVGTLLGGRLGFLVVYTPEVFREPTRILRFWEGGLSFHGGLAGFCCAFALFCRRHRLSFWRMGDALSLCAPVGILAVRLANFVNGELYGRVTDDSVPWAMRFPLDPVAQRLLAIDADTIPGRDLQIQAAIESGRWAEIMPFVPLRHPSQLYEAMGEGLLLGLLLWGLYVATRKRPLRPGTYGCIFLIGYGLARFLAEFYRQPDAQFRGPGDDLGTVLWGLTMGQLLSLATAVAGMVLLRLRPRGETAQES
jgi:phosphatidylglycerol:prolipoprotein diacylglycerol transferase